MRRCLRSSENAWRSSSLAKYCCARAHIVIVSTTRPISCLTLFSRSGVPICPRKYFETTMLVACCDQNRGISTSRCSKTTSPFSLPMIAARRSHSTSSKGSTPSLVKKRSYSSPGMPAGPDGRVASDAPDLTAGLTGVPLSMLPPDQWQPTPVPTGRPRTKNGLEQRTDRRLPGGLGSPGSVRRLADQYGLRLRRCQALIHYILCAFFRARARYRQIGRIDARFVRVPYLKGRS